MKLVASAMVASPDSTSVIPEKSRSQRRLPLCSMNRTRSIGPSGRGTGGVVTSRRRYIDDEEDGRAASGTGRGGRILALLLQSVEPVIRRLHEIPLLERLWKYTALGVTSIVFEEANPILGGIAARHGRAGLVGVVVAVAVGTWLASIALYFVGRWRIDWVRARWPDRRRLLTGPLTIVRRHPWRSTLAIRFASGLGLPLPIACGAARVPLSLYIVASGISCWLLALAFGYLGFAAGGAALRWLDFAQ